MSRSEEEGGPDKAAASHTGKAPGPGKQESSSATSSLSPGRTSTISKISLKIHEGPKAAKKKEQAEKDAVGVINKAIYTRDEFIQVWGQLAASYKEESLALFMAMTKQSPSLLKGHRVLVKLDNAIQEDLIMEKMPEILAALHSKLGNNLIRIETTIDILSARQKAYLPKEKLEALIKKNPSIKALQDALGLDLDY